MKLIKKAIAVVTVLLVVSCTDSLEKKIPEIKQNLYQPTWNSLRKHKTPQWLIEAKFGIYTHITLQTINNIKGNEEVPKHELIDDFKLENFNAAKWAELFQKSGAKFAGPVAWHGSGMVHWDSDITNFNTVDMGPGVDLVGELSKEIRKRDLKVITSFHPGYWYQRVLNKHDGIYNPEYYDLYGPPHDDDVEGIVAWKNHIEKQTKFSEEFSNRWLALMNEAITKYQPDISWVDVSFGGTVRALNKGRYEKGKLISKDDIYLSGRSERHQKAYITHFYNKALERNQEVEFVYKEYDVPPGVGMRNFENGLIDELTYDTWMTDIDMCQPVSWFYKEGMGIKDANLIIDILVDVTAKNGVLLLNVPPKPDGTFADFIVKELYEVGDWLELNGEAIYNTMPWTIYGEGPSFLEKVGHYSEGKKQNASYTEKDFRFTQIDNTLYAICLGIPKGEILIKSLGSRGRIYKDEILSIELLGSNEELRFQQNPNDLTLQMPELFNGKYACVFKIERKQ